MPRLPFIIAAGVCSLAAGCCCPALSGRYCEVGLPPPQAVSGTATKDDGKVDVKCPPGTSARFVGNGRHRHGAGWLRHGQNDPVPSQQQYDYISPLPKFHPAPTGPVFETQMHYLPPSDPAAGQHGVASAKP